jgi:hypothetical protein
MIKRTALTLLAAALLMAPASAQAGFGIKPGSLETTYEVAEGLPGVPQASSHPWAFTLAFELNLNSESGQSEGGELRDVHVELPAGLFGDPFAVERCTRQEFEGFAPSCSPNSQVGIVEANIPGIGLVKGPVYDMVPPPGVAAELGFSAAGLNVLQDISVNTEEGYRLHVEANGLPLEVTQISETIWGTPAEAGHDFQRGFKAAEGKPEYATAFVGTHRPFLTLPAQCAEPLGTTVGVDSKLAPGDFLSASAYSLAAGGEAAPPGGCGAVPFDPRVAAATTSKAASAATGLDFELTLPGEGLTNPNGIAETEPHKIEVALPEGVTANPSAAEGLATCSEAQYEAERIDSAPGAGCPEASKLGSVFARSPLIDEPIEGSLYLAKPYENPEGTLIGLYLVFRATERGVLVKQSGKVVPDPNSGRLITTLEGLPPLAYSDVTLHFKEGARGVLVTPDRCGRFATEAKLYPFSEPDTPVTRTAYFQIERGVDGGACPAGEPFDAGFQAGSENNQAGAYSPFYLRLTRKDGDQDLTKFSTKLPPGVIGRLAGVARCSDAEIAQARSRSGQNGGQEEQDHPSCPASSEIGRTVAGAGVGGVLTYVGGHLYLAGPYNGAPLSVVAIVPGVAGPFDVGTIVVRQALRIDPLTAEVEADGSSSDPIPHILKGIPLKVRDVRVYVDRPDFTLNPTSCEPSAAKATIWGGGANVFSTLDDVPHSLSARFQAASCASLAFKPRLGLKLKGGTRRGKFPALRAVYSPKQGDANLKRLALTFPRSEFIEQGHFRTICTRVQFAAGAGFGAHCPKASVYGHARIWTPLLDEVLEGPVYLRSSDHNLPDAVFAVHGIVDLEVPVRIDSKHGRLRAIVGSAPDAPVSRVIVNMQGGQKGLFVNSRYLCHNAKRNRAYVNAKGQNGRRDVTKPPVRALACRKDRRKAHKRHARRARVARRSAAG